MNVKGICGCGLAATVGAARTAGGVICINSAASGTEVGVGIGLIAAGLFILVSIAMLWLKKSAFWLKMVSASVIIFWIDGIINGFLLFGSPQISGQIINLCCVIAIVWLSRSIVRTVSE